MDIEEIKTRLHQNAKHYERGYPVVEDGSVPAGLLWIINKLEETPTFQIARIQPSDVLVYHADAHVSEADGAKLQLMATEAFPGHRLFIVADGKLEIWGEEPA